MSASDDTRRRPIAHRLAPLLTLAVVLAVALVAVAAAELPAGRGVDELEACLQCHDLSGAMEAKVSHAPVEAGECSACHNPHVSRFSSLLRDRPGPLCAECHEDVGAELDRPVVHLPVAEGRCADCHTPHGGDHQDLLEASGSALCGTCHEEIDAWSDRRVQHGPFAQGRCASCHEPHASEAPGLVKATGAAVCASCHALDAGLRSAHGGYPVERAACVECHDPHASARPGLFRESVHAPFESEGCTTCHAPPAQATGAERPFAPTKPLAELCGDCHSDQVEEARHAPFPHAGAGGGDCTACHNPHTGDGDGLLKGEEQALCLSCHDPGGAKSGQPGRHSSHDDLSCTTCHEPHGGERPLFMATDSVKLCGMCHSHEHGITHPLGEETRDPRTGDPMSCRSCHGIHDAGYEFYLHLAPERDLCLSCHKEIGGRP